jgi:hypothetical protein
MTITAASTCPDRVAPLEPRLLVDARGLPMWSLELPGAVTGALMFRVGSGDEPLTRRGLTHLTEHLALTGFHDPSLQWNGFVDLNRTVFHATGPQANVERFLMTVASRLRSVSEELLARERAVLTAEARGRPPSIVGDLLSRRYGTGQWGSTAWWELAVPSVTAELLEAWQSDWFTRENAVVWMTTTPSQALKLDLPTGTRRPPREPEEIGSGRGWFRHPGTGVAFLARSDRTWAVSVAAGGIAGEMHRELRERGLTYAVQGGWHRLTASAGALSLCSDLYPQREREQAVLMLDVFDRLAAHFPEHLLEERRTALDLVTAEDAARQRLDSWSLNLLLGMPRTTAAEEEHEENSVDIGEVTAACRVLRDDLLVALPGGVFPPEVRLAELTEPERSPVHGERHRLRVLYSRADARPGLVVGPDGVSVEFAGQVSTCRYDDLAAVMCWHDGTRLMVDTRGVGVLVEPSRYEHGAETAAMIDEAAGAEVSVFVGSRYDAPVLDWAPDKTIKRLSRLSAFVTACLVLGVIAAVVAAGWTASVLAFPMVGALVWFGWWTTRAPRPFIWDNGNTRTNVDGFDRSTWYIPGGFLLGWAITSDLVEPAWRTAHSADVDAYLGGSITAPVLYRRTGGILADDILGASVNEFFTDYLAQTKRGYDVDLASTFPGLEYFAIPDTQRSQDLTSATIDDAYRRWQQLGRVTLFRHARRFLGRWKGPQADRWAALVVQRYRHWRWS